jgi:hypothetical protein
MSEESLRSFLDRLANDQAFVERLKTNPGGAAGEFDLSLTERVALATNDEDGLRRLTGSDVGGFQVYHQAGQVWRVEQTVFGCTDPAAQISQASSIFCATGLFCVC